MIPPGNYKAKATKAEYGESKEKGTPYVRAVFQVTDGEHAGTTVSWDGYFTERTSARTIDSLRYCGCTFPGADLTNLEGITSNVVDIVVEHNTYTVKSGERAGEEQTVPRVAWVNDPSRGGIPEDQVMDEGKKRAFAARMKGALLAAGKKAPSPNGQARQPAPAPQSHIEDSDIPF